LLDRLESVIMDGIPIPLLPYSLVNQEKLIMLLDKIQTAIPDEIQQADQVLDQKDELLLEAQRRAQQVLQEAKQQAEVMLSESELLRAVHLEAERVRQQVMAELQGIRQQTLDESEEMRRRAYEESKAVRESADEYADTVLKTLSRNLDEFQNVAKNAQKQLKRARVDAMQAQHPQSGISSSGYSTSAKSKDVPKGSRIERTPENREIGV
jgi:hypothetical protein